MDLKLENRVVEISYAEEKTMNRNDVSRDFWDNVKLIFICILGSPQNREKEAKNIIEDIIAENFPILEKKQTKPKISQREEIIKIRAEINEVDS